MKFSVKNISFIFAFAFVFSFANADETSKNNEFKIDDVNKLEIDKDLLAKIEALEENTWLQLPNFKVVGDLEWLNKNDEMRKIGPCGRDYSLKMVWAPERKRALFCGAGHNAPIVNDVWEYDLARNAWICLKGSDVMRADRTEEGFQKAIKEQAVFKDGILTSKSGGQLLPMHTWSGLCYDHERKLLLWLEPHRGTFTWLYNKTNRNLFAKGLGLTSEEFEKQLKPGSWIWAFDPAKKKWDHVETGTPGAEAGLMVYIPDRKSVWQALPTCIYDNNKKTWSMLSKTNAPGYSLIGDYDPNTKQAVVIRGKNTGHYSFVDDKWSWHEKESITGGTESSAFFCYDTVAKCFILFSQQNEVNLWLYDPNTKEWRDPKPKGDVPKTRHMPVGYYDEERNVTVYYRGYGQSGEIYVYRNKKKVN